MVGLRTLEPTDFDDFSWRYHNAGAPRAGVSQLAILVIALDAYDQFTRLPMACDQHKGPSTSGCRMLRLPVPERRILHRATRSLAERLIGTNREHF
jgi:hypothetical protein